MLSSHVHRGCDQQQEKVLPEARTTGRVVHWAYVGGGYGQGCMLVCPEVDLYDLVKEYPRKKLARLSEHDWSYGPVAFWP